MDANLEKVMTEVVLRRDLMNALKKNRLAIDASAVILHHDNAPSHRTQSTELEIDVLEPQVLLHHCVASHAGVYWKTTQFTDQEFSS
ncbi:hypothetical protein DPMN_050160 [Dreissena polymorpha]|uniref:Transposase n=1 Tax=Dreissena polymorpha TaxID=45954 RepID=A0A9D4HM01_DREPO|nr:hypothetical protein DPMN_050160 [Dreissena polymorpha]